MSMVVLSLGEFLWSLLVIFFMVIYFMMLFQVIVDVFRRHDASGWKKAAWLIFLFVAPFLGLIAYLVTNSEAMAQRNTAVMDTRRYGYEAAAENIGAAGQIAKAKELLDSGAISPDEYAQLKAKALA
jgi:uncharacterized membrane protein SirB2